MNVRASGAGAGIYHLIPLLKREAELVALNVQSEDFERNTRRVYTEMEERLQTAWGRYQTETLTTLSLLKECSRLYRCYE